ncbi:hypothetical protein H0H93_001915 [Arthromyces matolae]|nr:hypothetical protein H0H93_001915 [Arthromyces matolae]
MQDRIIDELEKDWENSRRQKAQEGDVDDLLVANPNRQHFDDSDEPPPDSGEEEDEDAEVDGANHD